MFEQLAWKLLEGEFICQYRMPECYRYLSNDDNQQTVRQWLKPINLELVSTPQGSAWYAAWVDLNSQPNEITKVFREVVLDIKPLIQFLNLLMSANHHDVALSPGDVVRFHELLTSINEQPALREELKGIALFWKSNRDSVDGQLGVVLSRMVDTGLIFESNRDQKIYKATGKLEWFYELLDFYAEQHQIVELEPELEPENGELF